MSSTMNPLLRRISASLGGVVDRAILSAAHRKLAVRSEIPEIHSKGRPQQLAKERPEAGPAVAALFSRARSSGFGDWETIGRSLASANTSAGASATDVG